MYNNTIKLFLISMTVSLIIMSLAIRFFIVQVGEATDDFISAIPTQPEVVTVIKPEPVKPKPVKVLTAKEKINNYVEKVCKEYSIDPNLIKSMIYHESRYNPKATTGVCLGLMQINPKWHKERMSRLKVTNLFNPYDNVLVGVDFMAELLDKYKDKELVLMLYNMKWDTAFALHDQGRTTAYANSVISRSMELKREAKHKEVTK